MTSTALVWLITGTSSGLGRELALAALERGEKVIATTRGKSMHKLDDLKEKGAHTLELEVTSSIDTLQEIAKQAVAIYGHVDVVVNNAGYCQAGTVEEVSVEETYDQYNTHVFASMNVSRAFLPYMRERRTGTIIFVGSVYGYIGEAAMGIYISSKWALRGLAMAMHEEISPFGLRATCVDFGFFRTPILDPAQRAPEVYRIPEYKNVVDKIENKFKGKESAESLKMSPKKLTHYLYAAYNGKQPGDPRKGVRIIVDMIRGEGYAAGKTFPTGLCLGPDCYQMARESLEDTLARMEEWKDATCSTNFDSD
ncbi:hypothetical protein CVT24_000120 [Panaeolus cyanescens]|uniref:Uncharacterized protein n=1 Tax=Panaeolus cyanescens TaxID=181874 RepID=A0A409W7I1_9AGAR|nr:hypothetical protein CVT24_000120 [Panaeolus cyanescens]